jgi:lipopolysaccharide export system permease protein
VNLLHRHLLRELLGTSAAAVSLFAFVLLTGNAIKDVIRPLADGKLSFTDSAELVLMLVPFVLTYAMPMGLLTAILLTLGRVSAQNEITAMRTAGLGLTRIGAPALFLAVGGVAVCLVINLVYAPRMRGDYKRLIADAVRTNPTSFLVERTFIRQFPGYLVYIGEREGNTLRDFWVWEIDEKHRVKRFTRAEAGSFDWQEENNYILLRMHNAQVQVRRTEDPEDFARLPVTAYAGDFPLQLPLDRAFKRREFVRRVSWLDFGELIAERRRLLGSDDPGLRDRLLQVERNLHENASLAFSVLSFAIVGVPLGIRTRRKETSANLGLALLLTMGFYLLMIGATWLDRRPEYHPELLVWVPNLAFQALGAVMWWRFGRN